MKKLMILGGSHYILPVIKRAHEMGLYVITVDYVPDNVAHKYSDEYHNVSVVDNEAVLELAKRLNIDGIMSFACDAGVVAAAYVANKMGLPTLPLESVEILQNKGKFRHFLEVNGFNVPKSFSYYTKESALADNDKFDYPIIVKPVDSCGSKGVSRVDCTAELEEALDYAFAVSIHKEIIVEDFLEPEGHTSDSDCFSINGKMEFISFSDQYFDDGAENQYTPVAYAWPSSMKKSYQDELCNELQRLCDLLHLTTSIYNIETRISRGKPYIMECSPRGGGNRISEMIRLISDVDLIDLSIKAAIGETVDIDSSKGFHFYLAEYILHSNKSGVLKSVDILPSYKGLLIENDLWSLPGEKVNSMTGANTTIGTLVYALNNEQQFTEFNIGVQDKYKVNVR